MTSNEGGGTHPGDPWSPEFESIVPETPEEEWPYDESLTLSDAELEIAGIDDDEEPEPEVAEEPEPEVAESEPEPEPEPEVVEEPEAEVVEEPELEVVEELEPEPEPEVVEEPEPEVAEEPEPEVVEEPEPEPEVAEEPEPEVAEESEPEPEPEPEVAEEPEPEVAEESEPEPEPEPEVVEEPEPEVVEEPEPEPELEVVEEPEPEVAEEPEPEVAEEPEPEVAEEPEPEVIEEPEPEPEVAEEPEPEVVEEPEPEPVVAQEPEPEPAVEPEEVADQRSLHVVADIDVDEPVNAPIEEVAVEDLQAEPEWLEAVEEMTLDDIADEGSEAPPAAAETPTAVIESLVTDEPADIGGADIEEAEFEVEDLDDAELRADTAEHFFEALDFEEEEVLAPEEVTAEVEIVEEPPAPAPVEDDPPPVPDIEFEVSPDYEAVSADVDSTRDALAAFMAPASEPVPDAPPVTPAVAAEEEPPVLPVGEGQLQLAETSSVSEAEMPAPEPGPLTPEQELIASLSEDLAVPDFETFVQDDFARDYVAEPTQEHKGLAETIAVAGEQEPSALAATMPGVDHGHLGFHDIDEDMHFDDPDAADTPPTGDTAEEGESAYGSDLTVRAASGIILVALLAGTLWAGGVVFLVFIGIVSLAAQIEFYAALRRGGYRPLVLFGLLGGIGALVGTYVQGDDVLRQGPVAIPAALGFTLLAIYAWYGSQEHPPSDPWRNGLVTFLGVAWIPALLALVFPMAEVRRADRFQIIIVLLLMVAFFDIGSYFVGRALGSRKLSPVLSPNKTIEGLIGGAIATLILALLAGAVVDVFDAGSALALAAAVIVAAPLGDLAESLMKRSLGIKDMGQLIPGHGGVLDRIDSYLFAVPLAYLVLRWTGLL